MDDETRAALELTADDLRRMWDEGRPVRIAKSPPARAPATSDFGSRIERTNPMSKVIEYLPRIWKAVFAGASAGAAAYSGYKGGGVTAEEWIIVAGFALSGGFGTWRIANRTPAPAGG